MLATTVPMATPSTDMSRTRIKKRFKKNLTTPETIRQYKGVRVSPWLRKIDDSKLYSRMTGMPKRKIRRYSTDMSKISSGTDKARSRGAAAISPRIVMTTPLPRATSMAVWTAAWTPWIFFLPINRAMTTFAPRDTPINKLSTMAIIGLLLPTAAIASFPTN